MHYPQTPKWLGRIIRATKVAGALALASLLSSTSVEAAAGRVRIINGNVRTAGDSSLRGAPFFMSIFNVKHMQDNETTYKNYFNTVKNNYGINCVRICPWIGNWEYDIKNNNDHKTKFLYMMDKVVQWADEAGIYAVVNMHIKFNTIINTQKAKDFWGIVAPRYKDRTHVIYEAVNEPDLVSVRTEMDDIYAYIRGQAPNTHIICWSVADPGVISQANPRSGGGSTTFALQDIKNASSISYSNASVGFHCYPWNSNGDTRRWDKAKAFRTAGYPVICTEFQCFQNADNPPIAYAYVVSNIRDARNYGMSWIQWCPRFNYAAIDQYTSSNSTYNSEIGFFQKYKDELTAAGIKFW
jgi:hypothetical protein